MRLYILEWLKEFCIKNNGQHKKVSHLLLTRTYESGWTLFLLVESAETFFPGFSVQWCCPLMCDCSRPNAEGLSPIFFTHFTYGRLSPAYKNTLAAQFKRFVTQRRTSRYKYCSRSLCDKRLSAGYLHINDRLFHFLFLPMILKKIVTFHLKSNRASAFKYNVYSVLLFT